MISPRALNLPKPGAPLAGAAFVPAPAFYAAPDLSGRHRPPGAREGCLASAHSVNARRTSGETFRAMVGKCGHHFNQLQSFNDKGIVKQ
jgi:hypothetical protein